MRVRHTARARWLVIAFLSFVIAGCGSSTPPNVKSSQRGMPKNVGGVIEEKDFREADVELPPYPGESDLTEFRLRRNSNNRYYVDIKSIAIGPDRVVRYSAVIKSPSGALNTSYEGLRCKTSEFKVYAYGIRSGEWTKARDSQWRRIERSSADFRFTLYKDYFCDIEAIAGRNEKDLIANLKGNPLNNITDKNR
ncbi:MAG: CNP1-like family protein [Betaproteobacteria bacterium]|nr:CNP1-like family protein [Betaproteobacteria bacterium]